MLHNRTGQLLHVLLLVRSKTMEYFGSTKSAWYRRTISDFGFKIRITKQHEAMEGLGG